MHFIIRLLGWRNKMSRWIHHPWNGKFNLTFSILAFNLFFAKKHFPMNIQICDYWYQVTADGWCDEVWWYWDDGTMPWSELGVIMIMRAWGLSRAGSEWLTPNNAPCSHSVIPTQPSLSHETSFILLWKVCILIVYSTPCLESCHGNSKNQFYC